MNTIEILRALCLLLVFWAITALAQTDSTQGDYRLGPGDSIRISVFQNPDLTTQARVAESGEINFPLAGTVKVGGMTIGAAASAIADALRKGNFVHDAQVNIVLEQVRGSQVSVLGQVNRPGQFPLERVDTRLSDVLAAAGGIVSATNAATAGASGADFVVVTGVRSGRPFRREIDVPGMFLGNHPEDNIQVSGGDVIYVPPARVYYIYGEVQRPGAYVITRGMTVQQALALAGGPTPRGTARGMHVDRPEPGGGVRSSTTTMTDPIQPNDVLYVPESLF